MRLFLWSYQAKIKFSGAWYLVKGDGHCVKQQTKIKAKH